MPENRLLQAFSGNKGTIYLLNIRIIDGICYGGEGGI